MPVKISVITVSIRPKGLEITQKSLLEQNFPFDEFEWLQEISIPPKCNYDINKAYNRALRRAKGELIVSLQDYIKVTPDYLEKFWKAYQENPKTFFTAPVGKVKNEDYSGSPIWDWRAYAKTEPNWKCWEIDSGSAPLVALKEIGGFDETLDGGWSCDNLNVMYRAYLAGYKVMNVWDNPGVAYDHDAFIPNPFRDRFNPKYNNMRMDQFTAGLKIDYLG